MRKLLKYDMQSVGTVWVIATVTALVMAVIGGYCLRLLAENHFTGDIGAIFAISASLGVMASVVTMVAYFIAVYFFVLRRFFCHFFTDEGYLTFTLPVSRNQLLASKLVMGLIYYLLTYLMLFTCLFLFLAIGIPDPARTQLIYSLRQLLWQLADSTGGWLILYLIEGVLFILIQCLFNLLYAYLCITIGSIVAKRQKILAAIGCYYGGSVALSLVAQILFSIFLILAPQFLEGLALRVDPAVLPAIVLAVMLVLFAAITALCYYVVLRLLSRRLNLS